MKLTVAKLTPEDWQLWRNEFLIYFYCGFAPFYEAEFGEDDTNWDEEAAHHWDQWKDDLNHSEEPLGRFSFMWDAVQLN
jgi:hypothetical protein